MFRGLHPSTEGQVQPSVRQNRFCGQLFPYSVDLAIPQVKFNGFYDAGSF